MVFICAALLPWASWEWTGCYTRRPRRLFGMRIGCLYSPYTARWILLSPTVVPYPVDRAAIRRRLTPRPGQAVGVRT